ARKCVNDFPFGNERPRTAFPLVTTRAPMFFTRNQSAALLMLASGSIVATSVPFCLRMVSTVIAASPELGAPQRDTSKRERAPFPIDWKRGSGTGKSWIIDVIVPVNGRSLPAPAQPPVIEGPPLRSPFGGVM